jgi:hypothetical protein
MQALANAFSLKIYIIIILSFLVACGGSDTLDVTFLDSEVKTDTEYIVQITNFSSLLSPENLELSLLESDGNDSSDYELNFSSLIQEEKILITYSITRKLEAFQIELPLQLKLTFADRVEDYTKSIHLWDFPKISELNNPQLNVLRWDKTINALDENGSVYFTWLNLPAWNPPVNPDWQEDPYSNVSWKLFYHSLCWLSSYVELYERTGNEKVREAIDNYLEDYNETFDDPFNTHIPLAYREDASSVRVNHLLYLYIKLYRNLPASERKVIESLINKDIEVLQVYLDEEIWDDKNHGLIQAKSALNLIATFPFHEDVDNLESGVNRRLNELSQKLFSPEGYVVEQATGYHFIGLSMMLEAKLQLETFGKPENILLMGKIHKALAVGPYLLYDDGTTPAIGDTSYGKDWSSYLKRYYTEYGQTVPEVDAYLATGHTDLEDLRIIEDEGLVIAKHLPSDEKMTKVFFDVGKKRHIHGHYDPLNVVMSISGEQLLVDPGGPYTYSKVGGRDYWRYRSAHNVLMADGDNVADYPAFLINSYDDEKLISFVGKAQLGAGLDQYRGLLLTKEQKPLLVVVDNVDKSSTSKLINEYWHFAPDSIVEQINPNLNKITVKSGRVFNQYKITTAESLCEVVEGVVDSEDIAINGWVTPRYNNLKSAPVAICSESTTNFIKINIFTEQSFEVMPRLEQEDLMFNIFIGEEKFTYSKSENIFLH